MCFFICISVYPIIVIAPSYTVVEGISSRHDQLIRQSAVITHTCWPKTASAAAWSLDSNTDDRRDARNQVFSCNLQNLAIAVRLSLIHI